MEKNNKVKHSNSNILKEIFAQLNVGTLEMIMLGMIIYCLCSLGPPGKAYCGYQGIIDDLL